MYSPYVVLVIVADIYLALIQNILGLSDMKIVSTVISAGINPRHRAKAKPQSTIISSENSLPLSVDIPES